MRRVMLDKKLGQTPLQAIQEWKAAHPRYADVSATYAGRLDPMATGKLLVLLGDECKKKEKYTGLDKEYVIEVLLGIGSDTGDVLGIARASDGEASLAPLRDILKKETGTHMRLYPAFSSKPVDGKPLFLHALEGTLDRISIPEHPETIYRIKHLNTRTVPSIELRDRIQELLAAAPTSDEPSKQLGADFRIDAVRASWDAALASPRTYKILTLRVRCGSGVYMRTLAERIGAALGTDALALSIRRTRIGRFSFVLLCTLCWRKTSTALKGMHMGTGMETAVGYAPTEPAMEDIAKAAAFCVLQLFNGGAVGAYDMCRNISIVRIDQDTMRIVQDIDSTKIKVP